MRTRNVNYWKTLDWWSILLYMIMVLVGCVSIYAASYNFDDASILDLSTRAGKQLLWIGLALGLGAAIMLIDTRTYQTLAPLLYLGLILLLLVTLVIAPEVKGSRSWLKLGPVSLQPAEFGKFTTALMLGWLFNRFGFTLKKTKNFIRAVAVFFIPVSIIILQNETGTALVYLAFVLMLYREGMSGLFMMSGIGAIVFFVVGVKYGETPLGDANLGITIVLALISLFQAGVFAFYVKQPAISRKFLLVLALLYALGYTINFFYPINLMYYSLFVCVLGVVYGVVLYFQTRLIKFIIASIVSLGFIGFIYSVDYAFYKVLMPHQRVRIQVSLGMKDDLRGAGYNVHQAKIAIGSGGFWGKGILNGTQTKLKYVPEQDTDFIFCTIGEEEGFVGSVIVLLLFLTLVLRLIFLAERQRSTFARVYGYCVVSIFLFHLMVNVGMVLGLVPVIGIPLPFFSYGGSSLWSFSILLFIFLRLDASRLESY